MGMSVLTAVLIAAGGVGATIPDEVVEGQNLAFRRYWDSQFVWRFQELPTKGMVAKSRIPYSGYIYPDTRGGTASMLRKYDRAFHDGRMLATGHENWDTSAFKEPTPRRGLFGIPFGTTLETPYWHGHCNGWTAATMRHAEPKKNVKVNDVVFTPSDIKGLLAEIYLYNDTIVLVGEPYAMNAGTFHVVLANWLGRGNHPLGMEADPTEEKWNYPIYAYAASYAMRSSQVVEVKLNLAYAKDSNGEQDQSELIQKTKYFHYDLTLNRAGDVVGGQFYRDSSMIDLIWVPLRPKKSGETGHERGNPHVDVDKVLAIWRASVPEEERRKWHVVDPAPADRIKNSGLAWGRRLLPTQNPDGEEEEMSTTSSDTNWTENTNPVAHEATTPSPAAEEHPPVRFETTSSENADATPPVDEADASPTGTAGWSPSNRRSATVIDVSTRD